MHYSSLGSKTTCALGTFQTHASKLGKFKMSNIIQFLRDDSGATAIEYSLIAAGIAVVIIAVVISLGTQLDATFDSISNSLD
jgi:pilus assembly protein Flp/PilA